MKKSTVRQWLKSNHTLDELADRFPDIRQSVKNDLAEVIAKNGEAGLPLYLKQLQNDEQKLAAKMNNGKIGMSNEILLERLSVKCRIAHMAVKQHLISEATGISSGRVKFNLFNGYLAQRLLFAEGLERKPVSNFWFRLLWPVIWQRNLLMPLVQPEGIYCFYSKLLIRRLTSLTSGYRCLEVAAGDGTLTRFLMKCGVNISATDDYSWSHEISYPEHVENLSAKEALQKYAPQAVICSWPPAGNSFEQHIFKTKSVVLYIVIASRFSFAAGNSDAYQNQTEFTAEVSEELSALVLPPELDSAVHLFRRKING